MFMNGSKYDQNFRIWIVGDGIILIHIGHPMQ